MSSIKDFSTEQLPPGDHDDREEHHLPIPNSSHVPENTENKPVVATSAGPNKLSVLPGVLKRHGDQPYSTDLENLLTTDLVFAVMGPTGSGKSTFISKLTGHTDAIGHGLHSCTQDMNMYRLGHESIITGDLMIIDTPGFDDTLRKDTDVLEQVSNFLTETFKRDVYLSGILYLHRISDNRMAGTPLKNLRMFQKLCGKNAFPNVVLGTTMWDTPDGDSYGVNREKELRSRYWRPILSRGGRMVRILQTSENAWEVVFSMAKLAEHRHILLIQDEIVKQKKQLPETSAGQALYSQLDTYLKEQQRLSEKLLAGIALSEIENAQILELRKSINETTAELHKLKLPLGKRILQFLRLL